MRTDPAALAATLAQTLHDFAASTEPLTFYDALVAVHQAERLPALPDGLVSELIALHGHSQLTLGGRDILGSYLQRLATRVQKELDLALRPITERDSGKTARVAANQVVFMHLECGRVGAGAARGTWTLAETAGPVQAKQHPSHPKHPTRVTYELRGTQAGLAAVRFVEQPPEAPATRSTGRAKTRRQSQPTGSAGSQAASGASKPPRECRIRLIISAPPPAEAPDEPPDKSSTEPES